LKTANGKLISDLKLSEDAKLMLSKSVTDLSKTQEDLKKQIEELNGKLSRLQEENKALLALTEDPKKQLEACTVSKTALEASNKVLTNDNAVLNLKLLNLQAVYDKCSRDVAFFGDINQCCFKCEIPFDLI
jgi:predicted nuclease with TOPRIM domain